MLRWLNDVSIRTKLIILVLSVLIPLCLLQFFELMNSRSEMYEDRKQKVKSVVETAFGIISYWGGKSSSGEVSKENAQANVIQQIKKLRYDGKQYFWINDRRPFMIMHPFKPQLDGTDISGNADPNGVHLFVEMVKVVDENNEGYVDYAWPKPGENRPEAKTSFVKLYEPWGWIIGSGIYIDEVDKTFWNKLWSFLGLLGLNVILIAFLTYRISSVIYIAADRLRRSLEKVASDKDLTHRTNVIDGDEIGQTGKAVNQMMDSFQNGISIVSAAVDQVAVASSQLKNDALLTSEDVARQHNEIEQVASAVEEMSATTRDVSSNIQTSAAEAQDASNKSQQGLGMAIEARETILKLATEVEMAAAAVKDIHEDSHNISVILDVIRGISEQTNLLALNAAIEAARAGEHGRGFAVVADEVRNLSQRTQDSVSDIEAQVKCFQEGAQNAVKAMEVGSKHAERGVHNIAKVSDALSKINESIKNINGSSIQISAAAEQQSMVANEISKNVVRINSLAESTSQRSSEGARASEVLFELAQTLKKVTDDFIF